MKVMDDVCHVCGRALQEPYIVTCMACGRRTHFQSADETEASCSQVISHLTICGLSFLCNPCYGLAPKRPPTASP